MLVTKVVAMFGVCAKVGAMLLPVAACFWTGASRQDRELVSKCIRLPAAMARAHEAYQNEHGINCNPEILMSPPVAATFLLPALRAEIAASGAQAHTPSAGALPAPTRPTGTKLTRPKLSDR